MNIRYLFVFALIAMAAFSCQKPNEMSNIPQISLSYFVAPNGSNAVRIGMDTAVLSFTIADGDADLGRDQSGTDYDIYIRDLRSGDFLGYFFPEFDKSIENPKKGIVGHCEFLFSPDLLIPRSDTIHIQNDTTSFEFYIVDRAGHESNHLFTPQIIMYK